MDYKFNEHCQIKMLNRIYKHFIGYKTDGTFVEVGAWDGVTHSNTDGLANVGWRGLYIEPVKEYYELCKANHSANPNVTCLNLAVGLESKQVEIGKNSALSSVSNERTEMYKTIDWFKDAISEEKELVQMDTLQNVLINQNIKKDFEVLIVDVEGLELDVLKSISFETFKPKLIIVETHEYSENEKLRADYPKVANYLQEKNYLKVYSDEVNSIWINSELEFTNRFLYYKH